METSCNLDKNMYILETNLHLVDGDALCNLTLISLSIEKDIIGLGGDRQLHKFLYVPFLFFPDPIVRLNT